MTQTPAPPAGAPASPWTVPVLLAMVFVSLIGTGLVMPLLPFYGLLYKVPAWKVALLFTAFSAGQFTGELTWGSLSDRVGRRPIILVTVLGAALGHASLAFAPSIWLAIAARFVTGLFSGNVSVLQSYMSDVSPPERLASRLGMIGSALGVGFIVGPAIGGLLARPELGLAGFRAPLLAAAAACLTAGIGGLLFLRESRHGARGAGGPGLAAALGDALREPVLQRLLAATFVAYVGWSGTWSMVGLWGHAEYGWSPRTVGVLIAGTGIAVVVGQGLFADRAARRLGEAGAVGIGQGAAGAALAAVALWAWEPAAMPLLLIAVAGNATAQPSANFLICRAAGADRQGAILGANAASAALARIMGPMAAGFLFSAVGHKAPFLFGAAVMVPAVWLTWRGALRLHARQLGEP